MGCSLRAEGLTYVYPAGVKALDGVDFVAGPGEFVIILGPNGSGKTTLLRHFNGMLHPAEGRATVDGKEVSCGKGDWPDKAVGFVFQGSNDHVNGMSVWESIALGLRNMGLSSEEISNKVNASLETIGLSGFESRLLESLSFGQKRRAALAGVLATQPSALVLDEPTSGLDPLGATRLMALLYRLNRQEGVTIVVATHDVDLVPAYAERVYLLYGGRVITSGKPPEVFSQMEMIRRSDLRLPRTAHILKLVDAELGHSWASLPITLEEPAPLAEHREAGMVEARRGFTTGAAAAAAARAASELLFQGRKSSTVELRSPIGAILKIPVYDVQLLDGATGPYAIATVIKDAGDPRDVTDGAEICAMVIAMDKAGVLIEGGTGVGTVMKAGLPVPAGRPAINPVPQQMIADAVSSILPPNRGAKVVISVPRGEELAKRTLNPQAGIVGGIAILGVTGLIGKPRVRASGEARKAILFLGHGSRAAEANEGMYRTIELIKQLTGDEIVEAGFMGLNPPSIHDGAAVCIAQGATKIVMIPYFLHLGVHVQKDLPDTVKELKRQYPDVEITLGQHIGFHPKLAEIIIERIGETEGDEGEAEEGA